MKHIPILFIGLRFQFNVTSAVLLIYSLFLPMGIASDVPFADVPFDVTDIPEPAPPPKEVRDFFDLDPYYQQWISVRGFPVLASSEVSPYTVKEAAWIIGQMIGHHPDVLRVMAERTVRFAIVPHNKHTSDMPESNTGRLSFFWDVRHRAVHCRGCPIASETEEDLIGKFSSPIHNFGHLLQDWGLNGVDPTLNNRVTTLYDMAKAEGLYQGYYAGSTESEYWAEGVTSWFHDTNQKQHVALTRSALKKYDPRLAKLLTEVFGDGDWRYTRPATRTHLPHLQGFNPQEAPIYQRPPELLELEKQLLDPNSDGGGKWVNLKLFDPSALSHLKRLTTGRNRTDFIFGNLTGTDLTLYTVDDDGKKTVRYYSTTDDFMALDTYVGAIWLIQDHTGKGIAVFRAEEEVGRVLITPTTVFITSGLSKVSGANQTGVSGALLTNPFVVEVREENLSVLEGIVVTFTVTAGDGTLSVTHTMTDESGRAESTLTLGQNPGTNTVSVSAAGIEGAVTFDAIAAAAVDLPDPNLRAEVLTARGKSKNDPITPSEMARLTRLEAQNANISDLTGLEHATNLTNLFLGDTHVEGEGWINSNSIKDISPLAELTNLTWLNLSQNNITDLSPLAELINLTWLDIGGNNLSNILAVSGLINLTALRLWRNNISDVSPVADLTHLTELNLDGNNISNISAVAGLTDLAKLRLTHNRISDLSPLVTNTGLGRGDTVNVQYNPLSYQSIHTHIPALQSRGVTVEFDNRTPTMLRKISDVVTELDKLVAVEVKDSEGFPFEGVPVTFTFTSGGGTVDVINTTTDANGRAYSTLTPGSDDGVNTILVSAEEIQQTVTFTVSKSIQFALSMPAGTSLIHVPLKVTKVDGVDQPIESISDLYAALGGASTVNFLITYDATTGEWLSYFGAFDSGTSADVELTDDTGVIVGLKTVVSVQLTGESLGIAGSSTITLHQGLNLVGLPLQDSRISRVSSLFALDGIGGNVPVIILTDGGDFKAVGRSGDPGDIPLTGGQGFILTAQRATTVTLSGEGWSNTSAAAPASVASRGIEVRDTTPVFALRGAVIDGRTGLKGAGFRVTVKNLSTNRTIAGMTNDEGSGYRLTVVDIEKGQAAAIGDTLKISAQSPDPFIGVEPLRYAVTAEDVKRGYIQLPELVAYYIPKETKLLANYPNPFNPETWIPYRLADDGNVTLTIYDGSGQMVRTLEVGHRVAAVYESRDKAIYWDGRNGGGEAVASGVYFYHLSAGDYSHTRKMVILK